MGYATAGILGKKKKKAEEELKCSKGFFPFGAALCSWIYPMIENAQILAYDDTFSLHLPPHISNPKNSL